MFGLSLDRWFSIANTIYIGAVAVGAVSTIAIYQISQVISVRDGVEKEALHRQVETAKSDAANANEHAKSLEKDTAQLRANNLALEKEIAPRRLTQEYKEELIKIFVANDGKSIALSSYAMDLEAAALGEQFMQVGKWTNFPIEDRRMSVSSMGHIMWGISVTGSDAGFVSALIKCLNLAGLSAVNQPPPPSTGFAIVVQGAPGSPPSSAQIFIGVKPLRE